MEGEKRVMGIPELIHFNTLFITGSLFAAIIGFKLWKDEAGWDNLPLSLFLLGLALALLVTSADFFIKGAKGLAQRAGIPEVVIGLTIVSIGTSLPEILVTSTAAIDSVANPDIADFAIGGIFGSILVQITLILGVVVLFRGMKIRPSWLKRDGLIMLFSLLLLSVFIYTGNDLTRIEGLILILLYSLYVSWLLLNRKEIREDELIGKSIEIETTGSNWSTAAYLVMITLGLSFAVFAAHHLVLVGSELAVSMNVPHSVVGTTISGLGTSLPELITSIIAIRKGHADIGIGNIIGSNIYNILMIMGVGAVLGGVMVGADVYVDYAIMIIFSLSLLIALKTGIIGRPMGIALTIGYIAYLIVTFFK